MRPFLIFLVWTISWAVSYTHLVEDLFDKFGDEYDSKAIEWRKYTQTERVKIWKIWAALFSKWLVCFPAKFMGMHEPHMRSNMDQSLRYLNNQQEEMCIRDRYKNINKLKKADRRNRS